MENTHIKTITVLSLVLAISVAIVSYCGVFVADTYKRDAVSMAAQGVGQDAVDLFLVVPLLLISLVLLYRNNKIALYIFAGIVSYILYSFTIYCFGVYFNRLFLLYCLILGVSFYLFIITISALNKIDVQNWFKENIDGAMRYNYLYGTVELNELAETVGSLIRNSPKTYIIFNNHYRGQAIANALQMLFILSRQKVLVPDAMLEHYPQLRDIAKEKSAGQLSIFNL